MAMAKELCWKYGTHGRQFHQGSSRVSSSRFIEEMNRKKQREGVDLDWLLSNGLPNNTEEKPRSGANVGQGHLFESICQSLDSFLVKCINEIHSRSFHL